MLQKNFTNMVFIFLIVILAGIVGYFLWRQSITVNQATSPVSSDNIFSINLNGYFETCVDSPSIYRQINGSWQKVLTDLPEKGLYYLDDKFIGYGGCDDVVCAELPKPYTWPLIEYKKTGQKIPPADSGVSAQFLPVYQTVLINEKIRIDLPYFSDKNCQIRKMFSTVLER